MSLDYYSKERKSFPEALERKMNNTEAKILFHKLVRHFKLGRVRLEWTSGRNYPKAFGSYLIRLNHDYNNFQVLSHELAHIKEKLKYGKAGHRKRHWRIMRTMINYCAKKNWFEEELKRRTMPKEEKPEPSKDELRLVKIKRLEGAIKRHTSRIKRCQTLIKKANRRIAHLKRFV